MGKVRKNKRRDWEDNHEIIQEAYFNLLKETNKIPSNKKLSAVTKLSETTIETHFKELNIEKIRPRLIPMIEKIIMRLGQNALMSGKAPEVKLFMQVIAGYRDNDTDKGGLDDAEVLRLRKILETQTEAYL